MELIKLPITIGLLAIEQLKKMNVPIRVHESGGLKGSYSFLFAPEELAMIEELEFINPSIRTLEGIEYFVNLKKLKISTSINSEYSKERLSITDKDIAKIAKLTNLRTLIIDNQAEISWVYLDKLVNLEELVITNNAALSEILGLRNLHNLRSFVEYGNKDAYSIDGLDEMISQNDLEDIELDVLHFNDVQSSHNKLKSLLNCNFSETITKKITVNYSYYQLLLFHKKCLAIAKQAMEFSHDRKMQIIFVEKYLAEHIVYDDLGLESKKRVHTENGVRRGKNYGTNSAYNGIMYGSAVCEGYTRSMQYILKLMGIKTTDVYCISGADRIKIDEKRNNFVTLPDDGYHSIIRIDDPNYVYYCDPCWDSCHWHAGDKSLPYCFLTKKEMCRDHTLSFEEDVIAFDIPYPRDNVLYALQYLEQKENVEPTHGGMRR